MNKTRISIIVAIGKNRELGKRNELIWHISADLKRVKELTTGHPILMGRKTFESIGRPLPNRSNIVISRSAGEIEGCFVFDSLEKGIAYAKQIESEEIFIFGGAGIYEESLPFVDRLYLTRIDAEDAEADVFFPDYSAFSIISEEHHNEHVPAYSWQMLERGNESL